MSGPYSRNHRRKTMAEINVVPFIDVMLVLLVIFMITAPMMTQGVKVDLPQVTSEPIDTKENDPIIVSVDGEGQYYISLGDQETPVSLQTVGDQIVALLQSKPNTPVMVRGDRNASYGQVVTLMSTLQIAGVTNVGLISEPPPANKG